MVQSDPSSVRVTYQKAQSPKEEKKQSVSSPRGELIEKIFRMQWLLPESRLVLLAAVWLNKRECTMQEIIQFTQLHPSDVDTAFHQLEAPLDHHYMVFYGLKELRINKSMNPQRLHLSEDFNVDKPST